MGAADPVVRAGPRRETQPEVEEGIFELLVYFWIYPLRALKQVLYVEQCLIEVICELHDCLHMSVLILLGDLLDLTLNLNP